MTLCYWLSDTARCLEPHHGSIASPVRGADDGTYFSEQTDSEVTHWPFLELWLVCSRCQLKRRNRKRDITKDELTFHFSGQEGEEHSLL